MQENNTELSKHFKQMQIVWGFLTGSLFVYGTLGMFIRGDRETTLEPVLFYAILAASTTCMKR